MNFSAKYVNTLSLSFPRSLQRFCKCYCTLVIYKALTAWQVFLKFKFWVHIKRVYLGVIMQAPSSKTPDPGREQLHKVISMKF